jgi:hypothetical protein
LTSFTHQSPVAKFHYHGNVTQCRWGKNLEGPIWIPKPTTYPAKITVFSKQAKVVLHCMEDMIRDSLGAKVFRNLLENKSVPEFEVI